MVVNRGKWEGGGSWRAGGGWDSRSSQWKSGGLDGDWEGWEGWEDWDKWEEDPLWPRPSPNAPVDQQWTDVWKEGFLAGYSAASKNTADTAQALANDILGVMDKMELGSRTGSGGAEPESSEVVKKKKKSKKKLNWIEYTQADLDETPLFVVKLGEGEDEVQPYPEEFQKESYNYSTRT